MKHVIEGRCHCGRLSYRLATEVPPGLVHARACDCRFCRIHAARTWSDPQGAATIEVRDREMLRRYRFARRTADYFVCGNCGAYLGAVLTEDGRAWSTLNLRLSDLDVPEEPAHYAGEEARDRTERRKRVWTPTQIWYL